MAQRLDYGPRVPTIPSEYDESLARGSQFARYDLAIGNFSFRPATLIFLAVGLSRAIWQVK